MVIVCRREMAIGVEKTRHIRDVETDNCGPEPTRSSSGRSLFFQGGYPLALSAKGFNILSHKITRYTTPRVAESMELSEALDKPGM